VQRRTTILKCTVSPPANQAETRAPGLGLRGNAWDAAGVSLNLE
jgi:hypothetical protein